MRSELNFKITVTSCVLGNKRRVLAKKCKYNNEPHGKPTAAKYKVRRGELNLENGEENVHDNERKR